MDKIIRAGVVGVGSLGQHHARIYANMEGVKLTCVVDVSEKGREIADKYGAAFFTDYRKILDMVDVVSIAAPTILHYKIAKFFIENKKHVLLEKPMTAKLSEAKNLLNLYKKNKVLLQIGHIERFNVAIEKLRQLKKVPVLIEANRLGPFTARSTDISVVLDLMIHDIDIILQLVKSKIKKIDAIGVPILTDYIDMASVRLEFRNGSVANITASRVSPKKIRKIRVFEHNEYMSIDYIRQSIKIYKLKEGLSGDRKISWNDMMELEVYPMSKEEPLARELKSFIEAVNNKQMVEVTPEQAFHALKIVLEIEKQINKKLSRVKNKKVPFWGKF
ncbi:MAG: Gfo/Idh/MocA family oxidoreductase [Candidatus Goldbacteria bacterium]|nr:Gfo/Idh/MocA family oxidoreductase [Candidatus Goldiibacteriota bacterium]HPD18283.1 Gfo/Idh/MocA family oxidoreductase [Candidatus Goldiibacteriota bacterium]